MAKLMPSTCHTCKALREQHGPEARCTMHETSTSLRLEKEPRAERIGFDGPFLAHLVGYDPSRPVPTFDEDGKRVYDVDGRKTRRPPRPDAREVLRREREDHENARWEANRLAFGSRR